MQPSNLSRSALTRILPPRKSEKLRAGTAASNKRHRASEFIRWVVLLSALSAVVWLSAPWGWVTPKQRDIECAAVAKIDRTYDVIVCVRGIQQRYPQGQRKIPGSGFDA